MTPCALARAFLAQPIHAQLKVKPEVSPTAGPTCPIEQPDCASMRDIDLSRHLLLVRRGKNGEARHARLNSVAIKALSELKKRSDGTGRIIRNPEGTLVRAALLV